MLNTKLDSISNPLITLWFVSKADMKWKHNMINKTPKHHNSLLATIARVNHLIPSRTQKWNLLALMVVWGYPCESKSSPAHYSKHPLLTQGVFFYVDKIRIVSIKLSLKLHFLATFLSCKAHSIRLWLDKKDEWTYEKNLLKYAGYFRIGSDGM